jgi:hypothetical protein
MNDSGVNEARIWSGTGTLYMKAAGNVIIGQVQSDNTTANAIKIVSENGGILDGGDTRGNDIIANAAGTAGVTMRAATGIGNVIPPGSPAANAALEMAAPNISGDTTVGDIDINNTSPVTQPVIVSSLTTGNGNITFDQTGGADVYFVKATTDNGYIMLTNVDPAFPNGLDSKVIKVGDINATTTATIIADGSIINEGIVGTDIHSPVASLTSYYGTVGRWSMPLEVDVHGTLYVYAGGMANAFGGTDKNWLSGNLQGRFVEALVVNTATPGLVLFNNPKYTMPWAFANGTVYYFNNQITNRWFKAISQNDEGQGTDLNRYKLYLDVYGDTIFAPYADMITMIEPGAAPEKDEKKTQSSGDAKKEVPVK